MLDAFIVFTKTGVVLWSWAIATQALLAGGSLLDPAGALVREVLLADRGVAGAGAAFEHGSQTVKWAVANTHEVVFVAVFSTAIYRGGRAAYADALLPSVRDAFVARYGPSAVERGTSLAGSGYGSSTAAKAAAALSGFSALAVEQPAPFPAFEGEFRALLSAAEDAPRRGARPLARAPSALSSAAEEEQGAGDPSGAPSAAAGAGATPLPVEADAPASPGHASTPGSPSAPAAAGLTGLARLRAMGLPSRSDARSAGGSPSPARGKGKDAAAAAGKGKAKEARDWGGPVSGKRADALAAELDRSRKPAGAEGDAAAAAVGGAIAPVDYSAVGAAMSGAELTYEGPAAGAGAAGGGAGDGSKAAAAAPSWLSRASSSVGGWLAGVAGVKTLTAEDLAPVGTALREALVSRNVASEVAEELVASVVGRLEGSKMEGGVSFSPAARIHAAVADALGEAIGRILTPRAPVDVLRDAAAKRGGQVAAGKPEGVREPYVIVLCGVNGVGKSTTLAKLTFHLQRHGHKVMIAAGDSFRSGAVEQLRKHCAALGAALHQEGYQKDPVTLAGRAIVQARETGRDVVLVDTAGRMQNNEQLMQQLARLVAVNSPDLVLFVGEALVGHDGVDQLLEFDRALVRFAVDSRRPRRIDGIVLTKFDTVDDKVGATLSMVYKTGIPVAFLGVGQHYQDLRKLNAGAVVRALLS